MLTNRTLARINNRPRKVSRLPLLAVGGGTLVLAALLYVFEVLPSFAILAVLGGGALLVLLLYGHRRRRRPSASPTRASWTKRPPPASPRCGKPWRVLHHLGGSGVSPVRRSSRKQAR